MILTKFGVREFTITGVNGLWDQKFDRWELCIEASPIMRSFTRRREEKVFIPLVSIAQVSRINTPEEAWKYLSESFVEQVLNRPIKLDGFNSPVTTHLVKDDDWNEMMCATGIAA